MGKRGRPRIEPTIIVSSCSRAADRLCAAFFFSSLTYFSCYLLPELHDTFKYIVCSAELIRLQIEFAALYFTILMLD